MKKALAVLLAVLAAFSVFAVAASAEGEAQGTIYTLGEAPYATAFPRIAGTGTDEVLILKEGDKLVFGDYAPTASNASKEKRVEVIYYPDAASITSYTNTNWKEVQVPAYNLNTKNWTLKEGQTVNDLLAKSQTKMKTFYTYQMLTKGDSATVEILGLNGGEAFGRDSAKIDRGVGPIDYKLAGAKFVGWALYKYSWKATDASTVTVEVYALWDRGAAPEQPEPEEPGEVSDDPIVNAKNKVLAFIDTVAGFLGAIPSAISAFGARVLGEDGIVRAFLYRLFGITA